MNKFVPIEDLVRSESNQFALVYWPVGGDPTLVADAEGNTVQGKPFRATVNVARDIAKKIRQSGGKARISELPQVYVYEIENADGTTNRLVSAPVEFFGIEPTPKPEKPVKEKPAPAEGEDKPKGRGRKKKTDLVEGATSGSESLPTIETVAETTEPAPAETPSE